MEARIDTAHEVWNSHWAEPGERAKWRRPELVVVDYITALRARGARRVLDVGAGIGRHALTYARAGLDVVASDASPKGLAALRASAAAEDVAIGIGTWSFSELPMVAASVDHVLAWNVIYHGDGTLVRHALVEFHRILREHGTVQCTMLSTRHRAYGTGHEIRPDTFVDPASTGEKAHAHFYVDETTLVAMLHDAGFEVLSLDDTDQDPPGGWHWTVLAARQTGTVQRVAR